MNQIPIFIPLIFILTMGLTVFLFYKASNYSRITITVLAAWLAIQSAVGLTGFYTVTNTIPPRFIFLVGPAFITIACLFIFPKGKRYLDSLNPETLTLLHVIRIPVELVLFWLFSYKTIPQLMTFEGRNLDILSGISAPFVYYFAFKVRLLGKGGFIIWNLICLGLLINIVTIAILSAPFQFQKLAFDQPNIAVLYFPFVWLPCCVVPLVLLSHLASLRQLFLR